jgi:hypothetical protein
MEKEYRIEKVTRMLKGKENVKKIVRYTLCVKVDSRCGQKTEGSNGKANHELHRCLYYTPTTACLELLQK